MEVLGLSFLDEYMKSLDCVGHKMGEYENFWAGVDYMYFIKGEYDNGLGTHIRRMEKQNVRSKG